MTDHVLSFLSAYQGTLTQAFTLPGELASEYELYDCLRETPEKSTYLLQKKSDATFAILKVASAGKREHLQLEYDILSSIHAPLLPRAISCFSDSQNTYFLREYIAGTPVSDFVERQGPFCEADAVQLCLGLCQALQVLHAQTPPVIHRDIKPQNVIFTKERNLALIDFDAARRYQPTQKKDTVYLGTQATAAPEQFGYQQTDQRSDLYSTGILLLFLCTGSYELESLEKISSRTLKTIILTCTRFDPNRRYASVRQLRAQLLRFNREITRSPVYFLKGAML
ncbi:MAG: protein kinase, partial [Eubacteriales bacterium]|nr:protein kinase [Eubacteriales bacterium]